MDQPADAFAAVVLSGGTGRRLGGVDKAGLELEGRRLLDWALDAVVDARAVAVVGPAAPTARPVRFTREEPPGGGPAAGILAGRDALADVLAGHPADALAGEPAGEGDGAPWLAVLAVDMPRVSASTFRRLLAAAEGRDGAFLHDGAGGRQLCGVVAVRRLDAARPGDSGSGLSVRRLLGDLDLAEVRGEGREARDVDTWGDLRDLSP
ncbi:molybdenum cofactor guanylyltransferase [Nocardioides solisilvae]|uniref:molybdenum cofactor guanylyltransferase n=1 Tax=Nocardioides solisilvae TaxID=1542435 RepID=UPI000D7434BA|nr:NTP transferase domain-containing protein [Nocardioides solisilvae]